MAYQAIPPVSGGSDDEWFNEQSAALIALVPTITRVDFIKCGPQPVGTAVASPGVAGTMEGGSIGVASDANTLPLCTPVWQNPRTGVGAFSMRVKFPAIAASKTSVIGVFAGNTDATSFGWAQLTDGTHWVLFVRGGSNVISTALADTNVHDLVYYWGGGNITIKLDGTIVATSAQQAVIPVTPAGVGIFSSASLTPGVNVSRVAYGYVDPL